MKWKLLLFFDINKTIMVKDTGSGKETLPSLNAILAECTWGTFNPAKPIEERNEQDWTTVSNEPSPFPPHIPSLPPDYRLVTYGNYLEEYTKISKTMQQSLKTTYTNKYSVGQRFLPFLQRLVQELTLPLLSDEVIPPSYFKDGFYHILPAFFRFIDYVVKKEYDFRIVFRTFGKDSANVVDEFNAFCEGRHPYFHPEQRLDGLDERNPIDLRISLPAQSAALIRTSDLEDGVYLTYINKDNLVTVESGARAVYHTLLKDLLHLHYSAAEHPASTENVHQTLVLRDDFPYWHKHHESDDSGKLMLIDSTQQGLFEDFRGDDIIQIFFDDNIERNLPHIVDVRDIHTFQPIPFKISNGRYIKRVEPWSIITDQNYYIQLFEDHLQRYYRDPSRSPVTEL